jgi:hypothetical protein
MTVLRLIKRNQRDLQRLRKNVRVLKACRGPRQYIGEFERQIRQIRRCNAILRAAA